MKRTPKYTLIAILLCTQVIQSENSISHIPNKQQKNTPQIITKTKKQLLQEEAQKNQIQQYNNAVKESATIVNYVRNAKEIASKIDRDAGTLSDNDKYKALIINLATNPWENASQAVTRVFGYSLFTNPNDPTTKFLKICVNLDEQSQKSWLDMIGDYKGPAVGAIIALLGKTYLPNPFR
jgi:hypothetical protein